IGAAEGEAHRLAVDRRSLDLAGAADGVPEDDQVGVARIVIPRADREMAAARRAHEQVAARGRHGHDELAQDLGPASVPPAMSPPAIARPAPEATAREAHPLRL